MMSELYYISVCSLIKSKRPPQKKTLYRFFDEDWKGVSRFLTTITKTLREQKIRKARTPAIIVDAAQYCTVLATADVDGLPFQGRS